MGDRQYPGRVENYTTPALIFAALNLIWIFCVIKVLWGFGAVAITALALNHLITRLGQPRGSSSA
jgi:hypothetical protein